MIKVTVELIPHGRVESGSVELGTMIIVNDGTGTQVKRNYDCFLVRKGCNFRSYVNNHFRRCRIEGHRALETNVWTLVKKALEKMYEL